MLMVFPVGNILLGPGRQPYALTKIQAWLISQTKGSFIVVRCWQCSPQTRLNQRADQCPGRHRSPAVCDWMQQLGDTFDSCFTVQGFAAGQPAMRPRPGVPLIDGWISN